MLFSLLFYKARSLKGEKKGFGIISSIGFFLGAFAPGCAACGIGLASLLGVSAATLSFLPFGGLELSIIAILIIGFAIYKVSDNSCKINYKKLKGGKAR